MCQMHARDLEDRGTAPHSRAAFPGERGVATTPTVDWKLDTASATLLDAFICEGDTIARPGGQGRPGVARGEFAGPRGLLPRAARFDLVAARASESRNGEIACYHIYLC